MDLQDGQGIIGDPATRQALGCRQVLDEVVDQLADILAALGQWRDTDRHHVQAVEQVFAETALADLDPEVPGGRGDDAHVHLDILFSADPAKPLLDQNAQDTALALARHVADIIQVKSAVVGAFKDADLMGATIAAFLTEQLDIQALGRHASGRDGYEFRTGARAGLVNLASDQLLARTRRARDQDAAVGWRDLGDGRAQQLSRRRFADQASGSHRLRPQASILTLQRRRLQRTLNDHDKTI